MRASYNEGSLMENHSEYPGFATGSLNVQIQTTSVCTGKCIICPYLESWHKNNPGVMSDAIFHSILEQLCSFLVLKICPSLENKPLADPLIFPRIAKIRAAFPSALRGLYKRPGADQGKRGQIDCGLGWRPPRDLDQFSWR